MAEAERNDHCVKVNLMLSKASYFNVSQPKAEDLSNTRKLFNRWPIISYRCLAMALVKAGWLINSVSANAIL
jgi:hypothetical protein